MKKILSALFLLCLFMIPQIVSAEKTDFADKSFNFKAVRKIVVHDLKTEVSLSGVGAIQQHKLLNSFQENMSKMKKVEVATDGDGDLIVECKITRWKDDYYIIPEHTVWEQKTRYRTRRDRDGNKYEEKYYITVPVTYPPRRVDTSTLVVNFEVYDARTGKMVFGREDDRTREDANAQIGMFGRMCNSFFSDFNKKFK